MTRNNLWPRLAKLAVAAVALAALTAVAPATGEQTDSAGASAAAGVTKASTIDARVAKARAEDGKLIASVCSNCHSLAPGGSEKAGPSLLGVVGRRIASAPGYSYSGALAAKAGEVWTNANLDAFLADPVAWAPGNTMSFSGLPNERERAAVIAYLRSATQASAPQQAPTAAPQASGAADSVESNRLVREGLVIDFSVATLRATGRNDTDVMQGDDAELTFRITEEASGAPVTGLFPGAWLDVAVPWGGDRKPGQSCKDRVGLYLQGNVGIRPLIDLNNYYMVSLNEDATITVIDPFVGISGITKLFASVILKRPGADWDKTADDKLFFVSMPQANQVAVVDTDVFKVRTNIDAGVHPVRVVVQPDEKYVWVGNDSKEPSESGVTVIDIVTSKAVAQIPTGAGHHEIAFSDDSRTAFVSNRKGGTVTVIDVQSLKKIKDIKTGAMPISLGFSSLSKALYVADGLEGVISVIDGESRAITTRIKAMPGLGPLRFDPTGRWGLVPNSEQDLVHVIDASANRIAQDVPVGTRPFQVTFSRAFAYVRSLGTERVSMFSLDDLNKGRKPSVLSFQAGQKAPELTRELNLADVIVEAPGMAAVLVTSPADATVYYYMEGMNAPTGNFRNYGHRPLAVNVVDRALREKEPGVYSATIRLPEAGTYDVSFLMEAPQILHCFSLAAKPNPALADHHKPLLVEYLVEDRTIPAGATFKLSFQLTDPNTGQLRRGLEDVQVLFYRVPGNDRTVVGAKEVRDGLYEAELPIRRPGAYYVFVSSRSAETSYDDLPYLTLMATPKRAAAEDAKRDGG